MSTLIELGDVSGERARRDPERDLGPAVSASMRRTLVALALTLTTVMTVAAANPGSPALGDPLWTDQVSLLGFTLGGRNVYSYATDATVAFARDTRTGAARWQLDLDDQPIQAQSVGGGLTAVLTRGERYADGREAAPTVTMLDEDTGEVLGRTSGVPIGSTASGQALVASARRPADLFDAGGMPRCPGRYDLCTLVTAWSRASRGEAWRVTLPGYPIIDEWAGEQRWLVTVTPENAVQVHDARTGAFNGQLPMPVASWSARGYQSTLIRDTLVVAVGGQNSIEVTGFLVETLRPRWRLDVPADMRNLGYLNWFFPSQCGPLLCLQMNGSTVVIDPDRGTVRATLDAQVYDVLGGGAIVAAPIASPVGRRQFERDSQSLVLLDQVEGRTLSTFPQARLVPWSDGAGRALVAQSGTSRTAFTLLDEWGGQVPLGSVAGIDLDCRAAADTLACADRTGALRVWRFLR